MTAAEIHAFNAGVSATLDLARRSAEAIAARNKRPVAEGFAIEALEELATAGRALLMPIGTTTGSDAAGAR